MFQISPRLLRQHSKSLIKLEVLVAHNEFENISSFTTTKTAPHLSFWRNHKRRSFLLMEWTIGFLILTSRLEFHISLEELHKVQLILYLFYGSHLRAIAACLIKAASMMRSKSSPKVIPCAIAAWGNKLVSVIPGIVFNSRTYNPPSSPKIISVLEVPEAPRASCALT